MMIILGIHLIKNMCVYSSLAMEPKLCSMQYYLKVLKPESSNSVVSSELVLYSLIINQLKHHLHTNFSLCSCLSFNVTFSGGALGSFSPSRTADKV